MLRLAAAESPPLPAKNPAVPAVVDRDRAHVAKGRQALAHTTRPAPTRARPPAQPQPSTRPPVDLEAVRRMAAALARVVAAQPEPEGKPNCGGNIELITKWKSTPRSSLLKADPARSAGPPTPRPKCCARAAR